MRNAEKISILEDIRDDFRFNLMTFGRHEEFDNDESPEYKTIQQVDALDWAIKRLSNK